MGVRFFLTVLVVLALRLDFSKGMGTGTEGVDMTYSPVTAIVRPEL